MEAEEVEKMLRRAPTECTEQYRAHGEFGASE